MSPKYLGMCDITPTMSSLSRERLGMCSWSGEGMTGHVVPEHCSNKKNRSTTYSPFEASSWQKGRTMTWAGGMSLFRWKPCKISARHRPHRSSAICRHPAREMTLASMDEEAYSRPTPLFYITLLPHMLPSGQNFGRHIWKETWGHLLLQFSETKVSPPAWFLRRPEQLQEVTPEYPILARFTTSYT
jgi:hypothetical protein